MSASASRSPASTSSKGLADYDFDPDNDTHKENKGGPKDREPLSAIDSRETILREMVSQKIREKMQELQSKFVGDMDEKLSQIVEELVQEVETSDILLGYQLFGDTSNYANRKRDLDKSSLLPDKQFLARNSLLTDLFRIKHIRTIYHIFIVILIILFLNSSINDIMDTGRLNFGVDLIIWNFGKIQTVIMVWLCMMGTTLCVYPSFHLYASYRTRLEHSKRRSWDLGWLVVLVTYQCTFLHLPLQSVLEHNFPPGSSLIILMEQVRLLMKSHAFVRSNITRARKFKPKKDTDDGKEDSPCPGFSSFLYFLFVPTLVYRDSYPRNKQVRWREVAWSFLEVLGVIFYTSFIFERLLIPDFRKFGQKPLTGKTLVLSMFGSMMSGTLAMLCAFFCLLHSWHNAFAEMTGFADRMFYKDWWNSTSFSAYYRTWNVIVHDWLYTYIYKELCENVMPHNRVIPKLMVFGVSALFHEYILTFTFRFFYPVLLLLFGGFGVALTFVQRKDAGGNVLMWLSLTVGNGLLLSLLSMEWYARINCPAVHNTLLDFFVPRSWTCQPSHN